MKQSTLSHGMLGVLCTLILCSWLLGASLRSEAMPLDQQPILKLDISYKPSFLDLYAMQYEVSDLPTITNASELTSTIQRYESLRAEKQTDVQVAYDRLHTAVAIKYYLDRTRAIGKGLGSEQVGLSSSRVRSLVAKAIQDVQRDSAFLFRKTKDDRALFQYFRHTIGTITPSSLKELAKILKDPQAPPALKYRVYFVQLYYGVSSEAAVLNLKTVKNLEGRYYSRIKGISAAAHIAASLALSAAYAGVKQGQKIRRQTHPHYMRYLKEVTSRLTRMDANLKERVLAQVLNIWSLAEKRDFSSLPFPLSQATDTSYYHPLLEREALAKRARDIKSTRKLYGHKEWQVVYRRLATQPQLEAYHHLFLKRLLDDRLAEYRDTQNPMALEKEVRWQMKKIMPRRQDQPALKNYYGTLLGAYRSLIERETQIALKPTTPAQKRTAFIALVERYLKAVPAGPTQKAELFERQGRVFVLGKQLSQAVKKFLAASTLMQTPSRKIYYLDLALSAQRTLARWPQRPPFGAAVPQAPPGTIKTLAHLYRKKITEVSIASSQAKEGAAATVPWNDIAHLALLLSFLRQDIQAADLLFKTLKDLPQHTLAAPAAFLTLQIYEAKRLWQKLEELSLLLLKNKVLPTQNRRTTDPKSKLALALMEGGKQLYTQKKYAEAIEKIRTYLQWFPRSKDSTTARFILARSYWGHKDHLAAMNELQVITRNDKKFPQYKQVVLLGLQWAQALAMEEAAIFFSEAYVETYKEGRTQYDLRVQLRGLYEGTERYRESVRNLLALKASPYSSPQQKDAFDLELLWNIKEYGSTEEALRVSEDMIKTSKDASVLAEAFKMRTHVFAEKRDIPRLQDLNKKLDSHSFQTTELREARAAVLLALLKLSDTKRLEQEVQSIALKAPEAYVKSVFNEFNKFLGFYKKLCSLGSPSSCLEATHWLNMQGTKAKENISEVQINASLNEEVKQRFTSQKNAALRGIDSVLESTRKQSSALMSHSGGTPQTVLNMLWIQNKDWNFDPLTWGQSSGYIYWEVQEEHEE